VLIEDTESDLLLTVRALQRGGFELTYERVETREALETALASGGWDLIISDFHLPHFSAPIALTYVRTYYPDLPFIVLSGTAAPEMGTLVMKGGANAYLTKDELAQLPATVARVLREAAYQRQRKPRT
jgi:DNA-binding NtrC family response regulator